MSVRKRLKAHREILLLALKNTRLNHPVSRPCRCDEEFISIEALGIPSDIYYCCRCPGEFYGKPHGRTDAETLKELDRFYA